jgi:hypothetical protein
MCLRRAIIDESVRPSREESVVVADELIFFETNSIFERWLFFFFFSLGVALLCFLSCFCLCNVLSFFLSFYLSVSLYLFPDIFCFLSCTLSGVPAAVPRTSSPLHLRPHHHSERLLGGQSDNTLFESCHLLQAAPNFCARLLFKSPSVWLFLLLQQQPP